MNPEQQVVFDYVRTHPDHSVLITGPAGTGKTYLTKAILAYFESSQPPNTLGITGSTGAAAVLIGGRTLHSFLGIGLGKLPPDVIARTMTKKNQTKLCRLRTLVIDEVSMLSAALINLIDAVLRSVRSKDLPFGGVRCLFIGDACQLPPVSGAYFFLSDAWKSANIHVFQLTTLVRQQGDTRFQELLSRARWGYNSLTPEDIALLHSRLGAKGSYMAVGIKPTKLYAINYHVDEENEKAYRALLSTNPTKATYKTQFIDPTGTFKLATLHKYAEQARIPPQIDLCIGAKVMVIWNQDSESGVVNGTRGIVSQLLEDSVVLNDIRGHRITIPYATLDYHDDSTAKVLYKSNEQPSIRFMPLRLAYAISIHKSQGTTLDAAEMNLGESIFEYGQAYTALTRVKSLEALRLTAFTPKAFRTHPDVLAFYGELQYQKPI